MRKGHISLYLSPSTKRRILIRNTDPEVMLETCNTTKRFKIPSHLHLVRDADTIDFRLCQIHS